MFFANHYSFPYNPKGSKGLVNQFHQTEYKPKKLVTNQNGFLGSRTDSDKKAWFRDGVMIPAADYSGTFMNYFHSPEREAIIDMIRFPWVQEGVGKRLAGSRKEEEPKRMRATSQLESKWLEYKIENVFLFAIKNKGEYNITASIYDKLSRSAHEERLGFSFSMKRLDTRHVAKKVREYVESLP